MNSDNSNRKGIKITLLVIIIILGIEIIFASILYIIKKRNNNNESLNNSKEKQIRLITEIEKEAINKKNIEKFNIPKKINTNPRTRALPKL
jgi:Na+-transporting NADH:ubiquinone oxidoreductase subunit NqrC